MLFIKTIHGLIKSFPLMNVLYPFNSRLSWHYILTAVYMGLFCVTMLERDKILN